MYPFSGVQCEVGDKLEAVVLYLDTVAKCVEHTAWMVPYYQEKKYIIKCLFNIVLFLFSGVQCKVGDKLEAVVLYVDTVAKCVEHTACMVPYNSLFNIVFYLFSGVQCKVGDTLEAVVLYVDTVAKCVELSAIPEVVDAIKHRQENKFSKVSS